MAKDITTISKANGGKTKQSLATYKAKHRQYSAASADRKKAAGMCRVSVWVPSWAENILKQFAKRLCEGRTPDDIRGAQAGEGKIGGRGSIPPRPLRKRKAMPRDDGQLDLFGPA
jgi:hypothetical protein